MTRGIVALVGLALVGAACGGSREKAIEKINQDEQTVKWAGAAVNQVIRASTDCEAAKPLMQEAYQRIEEARQKVSAPATGATLDALKAQVDRVAQACP